MRKVNNWMRAASCQCAHGVADIQRGSSQQVPGATMTMCYKNPGQWFTRRWLPAHGDSVPCPAFWLALLAVGAFFVLVNWLLQGELYGRVFRESVVVVIVIIVQGPWCAGVGTHNLKSLQNAYCNLFWRLRVRFLLWLWPCVCNILFIKHPFVDTILVESVSFEG